ncbi:hypothetical protein ACH95_14570 [Bacillus glycinifermentans]|uniref:Spore germination protein n=1 Tax=Bacillus glycinifermentans TaxID=1664069 RepID=A0A0J6EGI5_9BACI|nr:spore germination protein [Bacillus glycinifermentans]ATH95030.1 spore germination protein [Bacillus glycinifermentans]KMM57876.1 hypothetical protein ACH95_14570 [Bacillus glycinifermentans]KRT93221.1 hypothetical protein AB447_219945 [Bacillus glycinifermentans]MEC0487599.1 spore germination protein [Bacillus glycinifermentans]MEC0495796.1 spore germination protein [Bacillus glycinifermentans]
MEFPCAVYIRHVSGGGVVNFGGAIKISPIHTSKTVEGAGSGNTGLTVSDTGISDTDALDSDLLDQTIV